MRILHLIFHFVRLMKTKTFKTPEEDANVPQFAISDYQTLRIGEIMSRNSDFVDEKLA